MSKPLSDQELDRALGTLPEPVPSTGLMRRVAEVPLRHQQGRGARWWWPFRSLAGPLLGWSLAALLGVALGVVSPPEAWEEAATTAATPSEVERLDDWAELALAFDLDDGDGEADPW
jgi:hypothetical protein